MIFEIYERVSSWVEAQWNRLKSVYDVLVGDSIAVPVGIPNTVIVYTVTSKTGIRDSFMISSLTDEGSYAIEVSQLYGWINNKSRHYWSTTELGKQVMQEAKKSIPDESFAESGDIEL